MKRMIQLSIAILSVSLILLGCQQQDPKLNLTEEIKEVHIFKSSEFKKESSSLIISSSETNNTELFETIKNIISNATKQDGVVDTVEPNYYLEIMYKNNSTKELYLWLFDAEGGKGSFMEVEDTHTIYNFSEDLNIQLLNLIEN